VNKYLTKNKKYSVYLYTSRTSFGVALRFDKYGIELMFLNMYLGVEW